MNVTQIAREAMSDVKARRLAAANATAAPFFSFDDAPWDEAAIARRPWIAPGHLLRGAITAVLGAGAAGKSSLLVAWAVALAFGIDFHRMSPVAPCRVLLLNTEDGEQEQRRRLSAALARVGRTPHDLQGRIARVSADRFGPLFGRSEDGIVADLDAMTELRGLVEAFVPDVIVLDPLIDLHAVDENSYMEMREVMSVLRAIAAERQISIVVAHHTRKGTVVPGDSDAGRGASAVRDLARIALTVTPMTEEEAKALGVAADRRSYYFRVDDAKQNYAPIGSASWFERFVRILTNGDHVVAPEPWSPPEDAVSVEQRTAIEIGVAMGCDGDAWSPKLDEAARSFATLCASHGVVVRAAQKRPLDDLIREGFDKAKFKKRDRNTAVGIRAPDGRPDVAWVEDAE